MTKKPLHIQMETRKRARWKANPLMTRQITNERDSLADQLPHRNTNEWLEGEDSDFPEPGTNPEHSGQRSYP